MSRRFIAALDELCSRRFTCLWQRRRRPGLQPALCPRTLKGAATLQPLFWVTPHKRQTGFTLIELLASLAILALIMTMLFSVFEQVNKAWLNGENRVETFTQARAILDLMTRELSQAIATSQATSTPKVPFYGDKREIHFVAPVNTSVGRQVDLCEVGYVFDTTIPTKLTLTRQVTVSTNVNWDFYVNSTWWQSFDPSAVATLANDTIVNLSFQYLDASGNTIATPLNNVTKLPYAVVISMDAVDSRTATKLKVVGNGSIQNGLASAAGTSITNSALRSFSTTIYLPNISP